MDRYREVQIDKYRVTDIQKDKELEVKPNNSEVQIDKYRGTQLQIDIYIGTVK